MPQPFDNFQMSDLIQFTPSRFREQAKRMNCNEKIADLAHFLVQNFREELNNSEHVVDAAIRLLKPLTKKDA